MFRVIRIIQGKGAIVKYDNESNERIISNEVLYKNIRYCENYELVNRKGKIYLRRKRISKLNNTNKENTKYYVRKPEVSIKTKRVFYNILCKRIDEYFIRGKSNSLSKLNLMAITGIRRIGKTILFKQLCNRYNDSVYIDCSLIKGDFDFDRFINNLCIKQGIKIFFIDEVCKLNDFSICKLISHIKTDRNAYFALTGSVPFVVKSIFSQICDGELIEMPPIMYLEYLSWTNNKSDYAACFKCSTMDTLMTYMTSTHLVHSTFQIDYIKGLIEDTLASYKQSRFEVFRDNFDKFYNSLDDTDILNLLKYVVQCQTVYKPKQGVNKYCNPSNMLDKTIVSGKFKSDKITMFCEALGNAGLIKKMHYFDGVNENRDLYLFEHPQYLRTFDNTNLAVFYDFWLEGLILLKLYYYYGNVGKYRTPTGDLEVDGVYICKDFCGIVEVKNRSYSNMSTMRNKYLDIKNIDNYNVMDYIITNNTVILQNNVIRNDILVLILEIAYIQKVEYYTLDTKLLHELIVDMFREYFD